MEKVQHYLDLLGEMLLKYSPKLLGAILLLVVGLYLIKLLSKFLRKVWSKKNSESDSLAPFIVGIVSVSLKILLVISTLSMLGMEMTSFIAILGAVGLAVGMAMAGTLQNFAGGVLILVLKPYKSGDFIDVDGYQGVVKEIQIFSTILFTVDNKRIIIPNSSISTKSLVNYTSENTRRLDMTFGIGYGDSIDKARELILAEVAKHKEVLNDPAAPFIGVSELGDSSVNLTTRLWVKTSDYWPLYFAMIEGVKKSFDEHGITIPFPQRDVHVYNEK